MKIVVEETEPGRRWRAYSPSGEQEHQAMAFLGRLHRDHAWLEVEEEVPPAVLRALVGELARRIGLPLTAKAVPGTARHAQLTQAGGTPYQVCPPSVVDGSRPDTAAWAGEEVPKGLEVTDLTGLAEAVVLDLRVRIYTWVHAPWSPVSDEATALAVFGPMLVDDLDHGLSVLGRRNGAPTAVAFTFREPAGPLLVVAEAVDAGSATAREDVGAVMREAVRRAAAAGEQVLFDGHQSDPHYAPQLATVPHITGDGLHLMRLP